MKKSAIKFGCTFLFTLTFDYYTEDAVCDASKVEYCFLLHPKKYSIASMQDCIFF